MLKLAALAILFVAVAHAQKKGPVKAVAKAALVKSSTGYDINLDGTDSMGDCVVYKWEIKVGGEWVRISKVLVTVYKVTPRPRKYKFKLTVYDKEDAKRIDTDIVEVEIPEDNDGPPKTTEKKQKIKIRAVAEITDVIKKNGGKNDLYIDGSSSKNCDEYIWELRINREDFEVVSNKVRFVYPADAFGRYVFKLTCINNDADKKDVDKVSTIIRRCTEPTDPPTTTTTTPDPCNGKTVDAEAGLVNVKEAKDGSSFRIFLSGSESKGCKKYQWQIQTKSGYEDISTDVDTMYETTKAGKYVFRMKCFNDKCGLSDSTSLEVKVKSTTTPAPTTTPDPCEGKTCKSKAALVKTKEAEDGSFFRIFLTGVESEGCQKIEWMVKTNNGYESIGTELDASYKAMSAGTYSFRLQCEHIKCGLKNIDDITVKLVSTTTTTTTTTTPDPCLGKSCKARAGLVSVKEAKDGSNFKIALTGGDSEGCKKAEWQIKTSSGYETIGTEIDADYKALKAGTYTFRLRCSFDRCGLSSDDVIDVKLVSTTTTTTTTTTPDPCLGKSCNAEADYNAKETKDGSFNVQLFGGESKGCKSYSWFVKTNAGFEEIGSDMDVVYKGAKAGKYTFRLVCENKKCDLSDKDDIEVKLVSTTTTTTTTTTPDPCSVNKPKAFATVTDVVKQNDGHFLVYLSGQGSEFCQKYIWERKTKNGFTEIGSGKTTTWESHFAGHYTFRLTCVYEKCGKQNMDEIETDCLDTM